MARFKDERDYLKTHTQDPFEAMKRQSEKELDSGCWEADELLSGINDDKFGDRPVDYSGVDRSTKYWDDVGGATGPKKNDRGV